MDRLDTSVDTYVLIERTKQLDPEAFRMKVDENGMPAGFVDADDSRRNAAYAKACAELHVPTELPTGQ